MIRKQPIGVLPSLGKISVFPIQFCLLGLIFFFRIMEQRGWMEYVIYSAIGIALLFIIFMNRRSTQRKIKLLFLLNGMTVCTTFLFYGYYLFGNLYGEIEIGFLLVSVLQLIGLICLGYTCWENAMQQWGDGAITTSNHLVGLALGMLIAAGLVYLAYFSWISAYLITSWYIIGWTTWLSHAPNPKIESITEKIKPNSESNHAMISKSKAIRELIFRFILLAVPVALMVFVAGMIFGTTVLTAAKTSYFANAIDYFPDYLFNYYGIPSMLMGGTLSLGIAILVNFIRHLDDPNVWLRIGLLSFPLIQLLVYLKVLPSPWATFLVGYAVAAGLYLFNRLAIVRNHSHSNVYRPILYLFGIWAYSLGSILPSAGSAVNNLHDLLYVILAFIPAILLILPRLSTHPKEALKYE